MTKIASNPRDLPFDRSDRGSRGSENPPHHLANMSAATSATASMSARTAGEPCADMRLRSLGVHQSYLLVCVGGSDIHQSVVGQAQRAFLALGSLAENDGFRNRNLKPVFLHASDPTAQRVAECLQHMLTAEWFGFKAAPIAVAPAEELSQVSQNGTNRLTERVSDFLLKREGCLGALTIVVAQAPVLAELHRITSALTANSDAKSVSIAEFSPGSVIECGKPLYLNEKVSALHPRPML